MRGLWVNVGQLESSVKADKNVVANLNIFAFGPTENLNSQRVGWMVFRTGEESHASLGAGTAPAGEVPAFCGEA